MADLGIIYDNNDYDNITITGKKMSFSKEIKIEDTGVYEEPKKKRGRPPKTKTLSDGSVMVPSESDEELPEYMTNVPYNNTYSETNNMLKSAILQTDVMTRDINKDLSDIRSSRTLKRKYEYISALTSASSGLLSSKITAIRELNKSITDAHNLELKRTKELKLSMNEQDDDKKIMDMYNAFISTPIGVNSGFIPSPQEFSYVGPEGVNIGNIETGYESYLNNMTPEQNRMRYESDPNIKTVVKYFSDTGARCFDVIDIRTGESIANSSKPDPMFLEDITIDIRNGIAKNTNIDTTYPLVVIGNNKYEEY